jgi:hypothetical protein
MSDKIETVDVAPDLISLEKFRAWLEGVEEMQDEGWTPTPAQWLKIRAKIDLIENVPVQPTQQPIYRGGVQPTQQPTQQMELPESALDIPISNPTAPVGPAPAAYGRPAGPVATFDGNNAIPVKTPNLEASPNGEYKSAFE